MTRKRRLYLILACCVPLLAVGGEIVNLSLLDGDWLRPRLTDLARRKLSADLSIGALEFSPWSGRASASDVRFSRRRPDSNVDLSAGSLRVQVRVLPLLVRSVQIEDVELVRPQVHVVVQRQADSGGGTLDKLKRLAKGAASKKDASSPVQELVISRLTIRDGAVDYAAGKPGGEDFRAAVSDLSYAATNVSLDSLGRLVCGAEIDCRIRMGGEARLRKRCAGDESSLTIEGVDLGYCDRYFDQADALVVSGGTLDLACQSQGQKGWSDVAITIKELALSSDPQAKSQRFLFVPVSRLIDYAARKQGDLSLTVSLDQGKLEASPDMEYLARQFWRGMWIAVLKEVSPESIKDIAESEGAE